MTSKLHARLLLALAALALAGAVAWSQYRVNARVNNRVGGEMYGNMGSVKYQAYQTNVLPSEARYATWKSGALPSEIAMNARAMGPLAPGGSIAYVPGPSAVQQAMHLAPPRPAVGSSPFQVSGTLDRGPTPAAGYGSIRYADPSAPHYAATAAAFPAARP